MEISSKKFTNHLWLLLILCGKEIQFGVGDSFLSFFVIYFLKTVELIIFIKSRYRVSFDGDELKHGNLNSIAAIVAF